MDLTEVTGWGGGTTPMGLDLRRAGRGDPFRRRATEGETERAGHGRTADGDVRQPLLPNQMRKKAIAELSGQEARAKCPKT